jgi:hypothetical protein
MPMTLCMLGFFVALVAPGILARKIDDPEVREWIRTLAWILFFAGIIALSIHEVAYPPKYVEPPEP